VEFEFDFHDTPHRSSQGHLRPKEEYWVAEADLDPYLTELWCKKRGVNNSITPIIRVVYYINYMHANTLCHIHFGHMTYSKFLFNESFTFDLFN